MDLRRRCPRPSGSAPRRPCRRRQPRGRRSRVARWRWTPTTSGPMSGSAIAEPRPTRSRSGWRPGSSSRASPSSLFRYLEPAKNVHVLRDGTGESCAAMSATRPSLRLAHVGLDDAPATSQRNLPASRQQMQAGLGDLGPTLYYCQVTRRQHRGCGLIPRGRGRFATDPAAPDRDLGRPRSVLS